MIHNKPDIVDTLKKEGIELRRKGKHYWCRCPLHSERTASFAVDLERQSFHCFGCQEHGDVITFIQKSKTLSFKEALAYLGINGKQTKVEVEKAHKAKKQRTQIQRFNDWCYGYHHDLCSLIRTLDKAKRQVETEEDLMKIADFYHRESLWLNQLEILEGNDNREKLELYREMRYGGGY